MAVIVALNFLIFLVFSKWYVYKDKRLAEVGIELDEPDIPMCHAWSWSSADDDDEYCVYVDMYEFDFEFCGVWWFS